VWRPKGFGPNNRYLPPPQSNPPPPRPGPARPPRASARDPVSVSVSRGVAAARAFGRWSKAGPAGPACLPPTARHPSRAAFASHQKAGALLSPASGGGRLARVRETNTTTTRRGSSLGLAPPPRARDPRVALIRGDGRTDGGGCGGRRHLLRLDGDGSVGGGRWGRGGRSGGAPPIADSCNSTHGTARRLRCRLALPLPCAVVVTSGSPPLPPPFSNFFSASQRKCGGGAARRKKKKKVEILRNEFPNRGIGFLLTSGERGVVERRFCCAAAAARGKNSESLVR
jgi:hypothetical protein